jgi:hypothetical protein
MNFNKRVAVTKNNILQKVKYIALDRTRGFTKANPTCSPLRQAVLEFKKVSVKSLQINY